jgi:hypothetical protein
VAIKWYNFHGRVTVASVKNFQLAAATTQPAAGALTPSEPAAPPPPDQEKVVLQFGKVTKDMLDHGLLLPVVRLPGLCHLPEQFRHQVGLRMNPLVTE